MPHDPKVFIEGFKPFDGFIAIEQRSGGNKNIRLLQNGGKSELVVSDESAYSMSIGTNLESNTGKLRYRHHPGYKIFVIFPYLSWSNAAISCMARSFCKLMVISANQCPSPLFNLGICPEPAYASHKIVTQQPDS